MATHVLWRNKKKILDTPVWSMMFRKFVVMYLFTLMVYCPGPSCSKFKMSFVNVS